MPAPAPTSDPQPVTSARIPLEQVSLRDLAESERFRRLDRLEQYYRTTQDDDKEYDWDGLMTSWDDPGIVIDPGWYVPLRLRRPCARYNLARVIIRRYTGLLFGAERWPAIRVEGDEDAEDFVRTLTTESQLQVRMIEARNLGGAEGTACLSFAFIHGRPRVQVHNAKHCTVLSWADREKRRPAEVLESYFYRTPRWDPEAKKMRDVEFFHARYWSETTEVLWDPIPAKLATEPGWQDSVTSHEVAHGFGFCPFYWIQNICDSLEDDGESDIDGTLDDLDEINQLLSATTKGTKGNVDPTTVIRAHPSENDGTVLKGSGNVIFSQGGAEYLELKGDAVRAAKEHLHELRQCVLDETGAVIPDAERLAAAMKSAAALRLLFAPMLSRADLLREQYGTLGLVVLLRDMLRAAKRISTAGPGKPERTEAGVLVQKVPTLELPLRVEKDPESGTVRRVRRDPGESEEITLSWAPYFPPTWTDIAEGTNAAKAANGGKQLVSQRTSLQAIASMWGVQDVDAELEAIEEDEERAADLAATMMGAGGPMLELPGRGGKGDAGDEEPPGRRATPTTSGQGVADDDTEK